MNYEYGVEYKCNGCKPNLEEDVIVEIKTHTFNFGDLSPAKVSSIKWGSVLRFRIVDERYKPTEKPDALTSNSSLTHSDSSLTHSDSSLTHSDSSLTHNWFERGELPPVGVECEINYNRDIWHECTYHGKTRQGMHIVEWPSGGVDSFGCLSKFRQIRTEREKAIEAAIPVIERAKFCGFDVLAAELYDAGLLRLPEEK